MFDRGFAASKHFRGTIKNHTFKLGCEGQGYYLDHPQKEASTEGENAVPTQEYGDDDGKGNASRKEKRRGNDGKRIRPNSRKKVANATLATPTIDAETTLHTERWWVKYGWWALDTSNTNSWTSAKDKVLTVTKADIVCTQETKVADEKKVEEEKTRARSIGWRLDTPRHRRLPGMRGLRQKGYRN